MHLGVMKQNNINDDDLNALTLTQVTATEHIIGLRTEESYADMNFKVQGLSYIGLPTTNTITLNKDTTIDEISTTGHTTIHGYLTITGNLTYNGDTNSDVLDAQRLTSNKPSNDSDTPLQLINNNHNWEVIALGNTVARDGCFQTLKTAQSPTIWNTGIWNQSGYDIRHGVNGILIYDNGDTTIGGTLNAQRLDLTNSAARPIEINKCDA